MSDSEREWLDGLCYEDPDNPCALCRGEGAIGTGLSNSFADASDAMTCPRCDGDGEEPKERS